MPKQYYVYILTNIKHSVLYTGVTDNLVKRVFQHKNKLVHGFTSKYNVNKLVYFEILQDPVNAILREKQIKNLLRVKKLALIRGTNPLFIDLYPNVI